MPGMDDAGWSKLTRNWALFFLVLLLANEVARQVLSTDAWVSFKVWGVTAATFLFAIAQAPMMMKHGAGQERAGQEGAGQQKVEQKDQPPAAD